MDLWPFSISQIRARFRSLAQLGSRKEKYVRMGIVHSAINKVETSTIHAVGVACLKHLIGCSHN